MYAVATIEKFINEYHELIGDKTPGILKRLEESAQNGALHHQLVEQVMGDIFLMMEFMNLVATDLEYSSFNFNELRSAGNISLIFNG